MNEQTGEAVFFVVVDIETGAYLNRDSFFTRYLDEAALYANKDDAGLHCIASIGERVQRVRARLTLIIQ